MNTIKANPETMSLAALNWAVAKCEGERTDAAVWHLHDYLNPAKAIPIFEREQINLVNPTFGHFATEYPWLAIKCEGNGKKETYGSGTTIVEAGMRCYLLSRMSEVEVPAELMK